MKKYIKTLCLGVVLMFSASALAQNQTVTGTVIDELGEPVIGATVTVVGEKTATITDMDGNYKIAVPKGKKVTITYIGYMRRLRHAEEGTPDGFGRNRRGGRHPGLGQRRSGTVAVRTGERSVGERR